MAMDDVDFQHGLEALCKRDRRLAEVVSTRGAPPFWVRPPGWRTLVRIILEQQVSLSSGQAAYRRLAAAIDPLTARRLGACSIDALRRLGLTRQKARYCRELAAAVAAGALNLSAVARLDDKRARDRLIALNGVGPWTADVYLLMALRRPDVWPAGDLALVRAISDLYRIDGAGERERLADRWRPWRAVAARVLWHDYLERRDR